jgi:hypothetical protein
MRDRRIAADFRLDPTGPVEYECREDYRQDAAKSRSSTAATIVQVSCGRDEPPTERRHEQEPREQTSVKAVGLNKLARAVQWAGWDDQSRRADASSDG